MPGEVKRSFPARSSKREMNCT